MRSTSYYKLYSFCNNFKRKWHYHGQKAMIVDIRNNNKIITKILRILINLKINSNIFNI